MVAVEFLIKDIFSILLNHTIGVLLGFSSHDLVGFNGNFGLEWKFGLLCLGHVEFRYVVQVFVFELRFEVVQAEFLDVFRLETEDFPRQVA